jgi:hypothetical protein
MELMPIIKASLGIFTIISSTLFVTAFVMYKIKSRNRVKPYERKPILFDSSLILEIQDKTDEKIESSPINHKFMVLNEHKQYMPVKNNKEWKYEMPAKNPQISSQPNNNLVLKSARKLPNEVFNIYNFYSDNSFAPMHKLKFNAVIAK